MLKEVKIMMQNKIFHEIKFIKIEGNDSGILSGIFRSSKETVYHPSKVRI